MTLSDGHIRDRCWFLLLAGVLHLEQNLAWLREREPWLLGPHVTSFLLPLQLLTCYWAPVMERAR